MEGEQRSQRPEFAVLVRGGRLWRQLGSFESVTAAVDALSQAIEPYTIS
jgi:hypothetical protein